MAEDNKRQPGAELIKEELAYQNSLARTKASLEAITDETEKQIFLKKQLIEAIETVGAKTTAQLRSLGATKEEIRESALAYEKQVDVHRVNLKLLEKQKQAMAETAQAADDVLKSLMNVAGIKAETGSSIFKFFENIKTAGFGGFRDRLDDIDQGLINLGVSIGEKVLEPTIFLAKAQDSAISQLKRVTAAGDRYSDILIDSEINMRTFGVSMDQAADSISRPPHPDITFHRNE